jgi:hypothetical protein
MCVVAGFTTNDFFEGNRTMETTIEARLAVRLETVKWEIADARRQMKEAADTMMRRAQEAVTNCEALMNDAPCSLMWTDFAESDVRAAKEARDRLEGLIQTQKMLNHLAGQN